jgi:hypothetical protein
VLHRRLRPSRLAGPDVPGVCHGATDGVIDTAISPARLRAQDAIRLMVDLCSYPSEQIGELESLIGPGSDGPDTEMLECTWCGVANPRGAWRKAGACPFCKRSAV